MSKKTSVGYITHGHGAEKIIALHSWMDDAESWNPMIPFLNLEKYTYVFMDIRGYGKSKNIKGEYNLEEIKNDLFDLADELEFSKFDLIGHSMCGMAAQYAALKDEQKSIKKVVLVTPVASSGFPADEQTKGFLQSIVQNVEVAKMGYGAFTSNRHTDSYYTKRATRHVAVTDKEAQIAYMNMWLNENFKAEMLTVDKPFLVIAGQYDHPQFQLETQKINFKGFQQVEFIKCENAGHFPMQETPVFLASSIESFFSHP